MTMKDKELGTYLFRQKLLMGTFLTGPWQPDLNSFYTGRYAE